MKYIMLSHNLDNPDTKISQCQKLIPIIFPDFIAHVDMYEVMETILTDKDHGYDMVISLHSAGDIDIGLVECSGDSESLKVKSNEEVDSEVVSSYSYLHGMV